MTIENLGVKLYSGTKADRKSDSLGSSADGANTGIKNPNYSSNGLEFTGGEYVEVNGLRSTISGATSISMACWINPSDITDATILGFWNSGYEVIIFSINGSNKLQLVTKGADGSNLYMASSDSISADTLAHVAFTYDTSGTDTVKLYINGALDSAHTTNVPTSFPSSSTGNVYIGSHSAGTNYFDGTIKQYLVYSDVLTLTEIQTLYNSGTPVTSPSTSGLVSRYDFTANANDSQGSNNGTSSAIKLGTGAYYWDGSDSTDPEVSMNIGTTCAGATNEYTLAFWLKGDFDYTGSDNRCILDLSGSNSIQFFKHPTANWKWNFDSGDDLTLTGGATAVPNDGAFHHICITRNSSSLYTIYVDGTSKGSLTQTLNINSGSSQNLHLGAYSDYDGEYWKGSIDDVGLWSRVLTTTEISDLVNNTETSPTVTDDLTSDLGWVANGTGNGYNASDYIDFKMVSPDASSGSNRDTVYIDLQDADYLDGSNLATNFVVRCKVNFTDLTIANVNENKAYLGFYDTTDWGGTAQDAFALEVWTDNGSSSRRFYNIAFDGATFESGSETKSQFALVPTTGTYYVTFTKSGDSLSIRLTTNSDYSGGEVETIHKKWLI